MKHCFLFLCSLLFFGCGTSSPEPQPRTHTELPNIPYPTKTPSGHSITCSREYNPICIEIETSCETLPCTYEKQTFENACVIQGFDNINILFEGSCEGDVSNDPQSDLYNAFFISRDFEVCSTKEIACEIGQTPFNDARGCGCINTPQQAEIPEPIDDALIESDTLILYDKCPSKETPIVCPGGWTGFNGDNGCGCEKK